ncbi:hypothetical protein [Alistipes indistinctus]|jgi:hypothetical protein|uniref:hypothetical protein n=1 Tax=Alistipes indistinctus TaxID=626932 RepID=UPI0026DAC05A|nr:hypothetical protein [Alistipes indistinctus]
MITKPTTKFALVDTQGVVVDGATEIDVTNDVGSWKELEIEQCREDTTGVISEVSFPITFHFAAKELLEKLFEANGFYAEALFRIYKRADFSDDYTLVREMRLDFSTYKADRNGVEIESINDDLAEYISSRKSTKYDIKVSEIADSKKWHYERMTLLNRGTWSIASWDGNPDNMAGSVIQVADGRIGTLRMNKNAVEMTPGGAENKFSDQEWTDFVMADSPTAGVYKLETDFYQQAAAKGGVEGGLQQLIAVKIDAKVCASHSHDNLSGDHFRCVLLCGTEDYGYKVVKAWQPDGLSVIPSIHWEWNIHWTSAGDPDLEEHFNVSNIILRRGERLAFAVINDKTSTLVPHDDYIRVWTEDDPLVELTYKDQGNPRDIDVIDPGVLLQEFIDRMTGQDKNQRAYTGRIDWGDLYPARVGIFAAESLRGFQEAVLHGKFSDFVDWMHALGYEYGIVRNHILFKPRDQYFLKETTALELSGDEVSDLEIDAADDYAYTNVKIGYDKQDYESINGRAEANGTFEYTTGFLRREEKTLELISPYRADSIGIELLCREADNKSKSTDDSADNDIFFVALGGDGNSYATYKAQQITDKDTGVKMFNAPFNPYCLVQANRSLLGITTTRLRFAGTDMNRNASIGSENIYRDVVIATSDQLFRPVTYSFATGNFKDLPLPEKWNGLVKFTFDGVRRAGFIRKIMKNYSLETETEWQLWASL